MKIDRFGRQCLITLATIFLSIDVAFSSPQQINPTVCVDCHDNFNAKIFADSVHGDVDCTDCHVNGPFGEHDEPPAKVDCASCHDEPAKDYQSSIHGQARANGIAEAPACADCHGDPHLILARDDPKSTHAKANIPAMCATCHADLTIVKKFDIPAVNPAGDYKNSVHGHELAQGNMKVAVCSDCHGAHTIQPGKEMTSRTAKSTIPKTCGRCHADVLKHYEESVHGEAVLKGSTDAPSCADCHGEHAIFANGDPDSPVSPGQLATKTCAHCHSDLILGRRYGFSTDRYSTFMASYHGLAVRRGSTTVANCGTCHGIHDIRRSSDPQSSIHPSNLQKTCGACHPGALDAFTKVSVHLDTSPTAAPVLYWARQIYLGLIFGTIGFMFVHNLLIYIAAVVAKLRAERRKVTFVRFDTIQLISHGLLFLSFTMLVVTGFGLAFPDSGWTIILKWIRMTEEIRRVVHRVSACVMLGSGIMHIVHMLITRQGRYDVREMLPQISDIREGIGYVKYWLRVLVNRASHASYPKMGRYTYIHKLEYWALIWGTFVMTFTGFALWFPEVFSRFMPAWGIPLMELIHYYEAWLATLAILVWHFFFTIFHPHEYPMSTIWLTGKVTREEMEHEHTRELESWERKEEPKP